MADTSLIELVEQAAKARNEPPVPRRYIEEALQRIDAGQEDVVRYPTGSPSLGAVYDVAVGLESKTATKN